LHPSIFWDNPPGVYNVLVLPDPYMFVEFPTHGMYFQRCSDKNYIPWEEKWPESYFLGSLTGNRTDEITGERIGRWKLMDLAFEHVEI
jgi:hypothetical protein